MKRLTSVLLLFLLNFSLLLAQNIEDPSNVFQSFLDYNQLPREVAYAHLNKSIYIEGETLGFAVYIFDKESKALSTLTRNVYCTISDGQGNIIKSKLILTSEGVGSGSFFIDGTLTSGNYTFKVYTNYMKNFNEQNYYVQNFRVMTASSEISENNEDRLDAQFLPEGGHFVQDVQNSVGVIIKDNSGNGIQNVEGNLIDDNHLIVGQFKTDQFGIARMIFIPQERQKYHIVLEHNGQEKSFAIGPIETKGISMSVLDLRNRVAIDFKTNKETLKTLNNEEYKLAFHNGKTIKSIIINFKDELRITKYLNSEDLFSGVNIFTLFNSQNQPVLERTFFNYNGVSFLNSEKTTASMVKDSVEVEIQLPKNTFADTYHFSVSVLPKETASYLPSHNIMSYIYLQPYVKGYLENAAYYFTDVTLQKKQQLDNLLITQGWSSYNWDLMFENPPKYRYQFEDGIAITASLPDNSASAYLVSTNSSFELVQIEDDAKDFTTTGIYPDDKDMLYISEIAKSGRTKKPALYVQFSPSKVPDFENYLKVIPRKREPIVRDATYQPIIETSWTGIEQLDEVVLNVKKRQSKIDQLKNITNGQVDVFGSENRYQFRDFATFLRSKGFQVNNQYGDYRIISPRSNGVISSSPVVLIDGVELFDHTLLAQLDMSVIDYVIVEKSATGNVKNASNGLIQVFTDPRAEKYVSGKSTSLKVDIPLGFTSDKKFYAPLYSFYQTDFFKNYGVIDWVPRAQVNKDGKILIRFADRNYQNLKIFIEGAGEGQFISESIDVEIER